MGRDRSDGVERRAGRDAVVIGGGPAGTAAAVTLARTGRRVLLLTAPRPSRAAGVGEGAPPGLDRAVDDVFGDGTFLAGDHLRSLGNRAAWGTAELLGSEFMFSPFGTGWHLDRRVFDARLLAAAEAAGVTVQVYDGDVDRDLAHGTVIDASGRRAVHAHHEGARRVIRDRLTAVLATYPAARGDRDTTTTIEAVEGGWWYTCPVPARRRIVAHLTDGDLLTGDLRSSEGFDRAARRTHHIAPLLGTGPSTPPLVVTAATTHLDPPAGRGWLAAGDAAASFDPVSSQGILTAVLMGREAALRIDEPDAFTASYHAIVDHYERQRRDTYRREQRWPEAPFWARRLGDGTP